MAEFTYNIVKELGVLSESRRGWTREINIISWNGGEPKYDIRDWAPDRERMGKGIALDIDELGELRDILNSLDELNEEE